MLTMRQVLCCRQENAAVKPRVDCSPAQSPSDSPVMHHLQRGLISFAANLQPLLCIKTARRGGYFSALPQEQSLWESDDYRESQMCGFSSLMIVTKITLIVT